MYLFTIYNINIIFMIYNVNIIKTYWIHVVKRK